MHRVFFIFETLFDFLILFDVLSHYQTLLKVFIGVEENFRVLGEERKVFSEKLLD